MFLTIQSARKLQASDIIARVSTTADGSQVRHSGGTDPNPLNPRMSGDGRFVVFESTASNLVPGDTNSIDDIFVKDLSTGAISRVSLGNNGEEANSLSERPVISANGRYVVFESDATNLAGGTSNGTDVFRKDLSTGVVTLVSSSGTGGSANAGSQLAKISADGRYVIFQSAATNLTPGGTNGDPHVFRKDMMTGEITNIFVETTPADSLGSALLDISADGQRVLFYSRESNIVPGDTNGRGDVFMKDFATGTITRISEGPGNVQANGSSGDASFSMDGRYVVFRTQASNLLAGDTDTVEDIYVKDLQTGELTLVSTGAGAKGNNRSQNPSISADGRYVVFESDASNLVAGDTNGGPDVFLKDLLTGSINLLSMSADGTFGNYWSQNPSISPDGRYAIFESIADNLVPGDTNEDYDVFRVDLVYKAHAQAILEGRYMEVKLGTGGATSATLAWGDGSASTVTPVAGSAAFSHIYASAGAKTATVTLVEGALTWVVPHVVDVSAGAMARNTGLADTLSGGAGADVLTGDAFANILLANGGNDRLSAGSGNDVLQASSGDDRVYGGTGNDKIHGGAGNDRLYGEAGRDTFVFDTRLNKRTNVDKIYDFRTRDDSIYLENQHFTKLGSGTASRPKKFKSDMFVEASRAQDSEDRIIYDRKSGALYYDKDGTGGFAQVKIATISNKTKLYYHDFFVI